MARTVKLTQNNGARNNLPMVFGAAALVAAGALVGGALANGGSDGRDGRHPGPAAEARMEMNRDRDRDGAGMKPGAKPGSGGDRHGDEHRGAGGRQAGANLTGAATSVSPTELSMTLADGTTKAVVLDSASQYFRKTTGTAADVTVGSYVLVGPGMPIGGTATEVAGIAVLANGLTDAHVHLGRPAKVTVVNGNTLTLEMTTRRGVRTITATIGANTTISKIAAATNADVTVGNSVVVDLGREATAAESVLIVK